MRISAVPAVVLAGLTAHVARACNGPRAAGSSPNCLGGTYTDCVNEYNSLCVFECWKQPPGPCLTGCTTRGQKQCAGYCMPINNCDDCIQSILASGGSSEDAAFEACSQPGDSYYCNCG